MLDYKGLKATREHLTVTELQIDRQLDRLLEQHQRTLQITDRPTQLDDEVVIDFTGFCDGQPFEGGSAEKYPLTLGSGAFIPGFEEQLIGKRIGDDVDVHVTFPVAYPVANLAGKNATFRCKLHEIHIRQKYRPDDDFAREVGGCATIGELRDQIREALQRHVDRQSELELKNQLMDQLIGQYDAEISDEQLQKALDIEMQELESQLAQQKLTLDQYCHFMNKTRAQLREEQLPDAKKNVLRQMIIAEIAEIEHIEADELSVSDAFSELCRDHHIAPEEMQMYFDKQMETALVRSVIERKVLDRICEFAEISQVEKEA